METRANYVLIGAFTLAGFIGLLAFFMWFARFELDRQFDYYDVQFTSVAGLSAASEVRFSGLPVGQVVDVSLAADGSGRIRVRIEVDATTPVRTGSVATIESQGVTGVSFVGISPGEPSQPLLKEASDAEVPTIEPGRSVLQTLSEDAPEIIEGVLRATDQISELLGDRNQERIANILINLEASSGDLGAALQDFSAVTRTVATASEQIATFSTQLEGIADAATQALGTADTTLKQVTDLAQRAETTLDAGDAALASGRRALDSASVFIADELPVLAEDLRQTTAEVRTQIDRTATEAGALIEEYRAAGSLASERLTEAEATIAAADEMLARMTEALAAVDEASDSFYDLLEGEGAALIDEARTMVANADTVFASAASVAENDLPAIVSDIRDATETASRVVQEVGGDLSSAAGRVDAISDDVAATLETVTNTFSAANETLARLNKALETGDRALDSADRAFTTADKVLTEDIDGITTALRETVARLDTAIQQVSADLPEITGEIRTTAERANAAFGTFQRTIEEAAAPVQSFASQGLPQYTRLARETRDLISSLEQLVRQIERDPARYLLGRETPEFRR